MLFKPALEGQALLGGGLQGVGGGSRTWRPGGPSCLGEAVKISILLLRWSNMVKTWPVGVREARHRMARPSVDGSSLVHPVRVLLHVLRQVSLLQWDWYRISCTSKAFSLYTWV